MQVRRGCLASSTHTGTGTHTRTRTRTHARTRTHTHTTLPPQPPKRPSPARHSLSPAHPPVPAAVCRRRSTRRRPVRTQSTKLHCLIVTIFRYCLSLIVTDFPAKLSHQGLQQHQVSTSSAFVSTPRYPCVFFRFATLELFWFFGANGTRCRLHSCLPL